MAIILFTDFGATDIYRGQVLARLAVQAPEAPVIELTHDAPPFNVKASAHLLGALAATLPAGAVVMAVVDPGVGGPRAAIAVRADGRWYVGPDNGLISVVAARAAVCEVYPITWQPPHLSASFHGRDLFAPVAARLERGELDVLGPATALECLLDAGDLSEVIYVDHYGNALTGVRASGISEQHRLRVAGADIPHARVFLEAQPEAPFWYENSLGLVEIAVNRKSAAAMLGVLPGTAVMLSTAPG